MTGEFISTVKKIKSAEKTNNYYFQTHDCPMAKRSIKIEFPYIMGKEDSVEKSYDILRFGVCPHCGIMYYTYESDKFIKVKL